MILELKSTNFTKPVLIYNVNINKILVFYKVSLRKKSFKYFIGYKDNKKVKSLCIMLPKMSGYRKNVSDTKCMSSFIKSYELLENYNKIWDKVSNIFKKGFD